MKYKFLWLKEGMKEKLAAAAAIAKSKASKIKEESDDEDEDETVLESKSSPDIKLNIETKTVVRTNTFDNDGQPRIKNSLSVDSGNDASSEDSNDSKGLYLKLFENISLFRFIRAYCLFLFYF